MEKWICKTCGTQFPASEQPSGACPICLDERQYVGYNGQEWTTLPQMREGGFPNEFREHEPHLIGIGTTPTFAIGERALLVQNERGKFLWDCMTLLDDVTVATIERLGGVTGMAISHPHYYSTMVYGGATPPALLTGDMDEGTKVINHTGVLSARTPGQISPAQCWDLDDTARTGRSFVLSLLATLCRTLT